MGRRGFKSADEMMIVESGPGRTRPDAPYQLNDAEAEGWRQITSAMQADYFSPSHFPALIQLCRHVVSADFVGHLLDEVYKKKKVDQEELAALLTMQAQQSGNIIRLMRQLRLTHQAIYRGELVKNRPLKTIDVPWTINRKGDAEDDSEDRD